MVKSALLAALLLQTSPERPDVWRECTFETAELCEPSGCKRIEPTLKVYLGDYVDEKNQRGGYYYRCAIKGSCDEIEPYWVGYSTNTGYRIWDAREKGASSRLGPDDRITDVVSYGNVVLISRGACANAPPPIVRVQQ